MAKPTQKGVPKDPQSDIMFAQNKNSYLEQNKRAILAPVIAKGSPKHANRAPKGSPRATKGCTQATPLRKVFRFLVSTAATKVAPDGTGRRLIARYDVSVAFFHAPGEGRTAVMPLQDLQGPGVVWFSGQFWRRFPVSSAGYDGGRNRTRKMISMTQA